MSRDHARRSVVGGTLMVSSHALQFAIGLGSAMVVARIVTPAEFGVFAMASVVLAIATGFGDFGVPMAIVNQRDLQGEALDRVFWVNLGLNLGLALLLCALGPAVAAFFDQPVLVPMTAALAASVLILGASAPQVGILQREMHFGAVARLEVLGMLGGALAAIGVALAGGGVWALVAQQVAISVVQATLRWSACEWRPGPLRHGSSEGFRDMFRFSSYLTYSRLLTVLSRELDRVLVGRLAGATALGLYHNANRWALFPVRQLHFPLMGVAVASFSRLQDQPERYARYARVSFLGFYSAVLPGLVFLGIEAHGVLLLLLGPQWDAAVPMFRVLLVGAAFFGLDRLCKWIFLAEGRTRDQFLWSLAAMPVTVGSLVIGAQWGALGVAIGFSIGFTLLAPFASWYCLRASTLSSVLLWRAAWRPAAASALGGLALFAAAPVVHAPEWTITRVSIGLALFLAVYGLAWVLLPGGRAVGGELLGVLRRMRAGDPVEAA